MRSCSCVAFSTERLAPISHASDTYPDSDDALAVDAIADVDIADVGVNDVGVKSVGDGSSGGGCSAWGAGTMRVRVEGASRLNGASRTPCRGLPGEAAAAEEEESEHRPHERAQWTSCCTGAHSPMRTRRWHEYASSNLDCATGCSNAQLSEHAMSRERRRRAP